MTSARHTQIHKTPIWLYFLSWALVWLHVLRGVLTLLVLFPFASPRVKAAHIQRWSKRLLKIFGIQLEVTNSQALPTSSFLLASNHVSWMDIHVINSFKPIRFVAKSEVEKWPIFGWMATQLGTLFIRRDSSRHARHVVDEMALALKEQSICIFPEGTSTIGKSVQAFKPNLFESAVLAKVPVCTLALAYFDRLTGVHSEVPAFVGDMGLLGSMARILKNRNLRVELRFFPLAQGTQEQLGDRKWLSQRSQEEISVYLHENCN